MNTHEYKRKLEDKLIKDFLELFNEKIGYFPTVITARNITKQECKVLTLFTLEDYFEPYLPSLEGNVIKLGAKCKVRPITELRYIFCYIAKVMNYTLKEIGWHLGERDHTTVIHALSSFRNLYETEENFKSLYHTIIKELKKDYESPLMDYLDKEQNKSKPNLFFRLLQEQN